MIKWFLAFIFLSGLGLSITRLLFPASTEKFVQGRYKLYIVTTLILAILVAAGTEWMLAKNLELPLLDYGVFLLFTYAAIVIFWMIFRFGRVSS
jgi:hypothetical protein